MFPLPATDSDRISDVFPADDPLAQFIVVLSAQRNDISESLRRVVERIEADATTSAHYSHRLLASHFFEAAKWLRQSVGSPNVAAWLDLQVEADSEFKDQLEAVLAPTGPGGFVKTLLWAGRNATFHYPAVGLAQDGLEEALTALADEPVTVKRFPNPHGWEPRAVFAEQVLTYRFLHVFGHDIQAWMHQIQDATFRHIHFVDACLHRYMQSRGMRFAPSDGPT